jgi:hypothetical protein
MEDYLLFKMNFRVVSCRQPDFPRFPQNGLSRVRDMADIRNLR